MKVCVDAGHGLPDPGAIGRVHQTQEQAVNLAAAHFLKLELEKAGHQVVMTRYNNTALNASKGTDLALRCRIANEAEVDCFVSIHCNSATDSAAGGWEIFHAKESERGKKLAEHIQASVRQAGLVRPSSAAAGNAPGELRDRGVKAHELYVLNHTKAPAVLIELAFISNPREEGLLRDPDWVQRHAVATAAGISAWGKAMAAGSRSQH